MLFNVRRPITNNCLAKPSRSFGVSFEISELPLNKLFLKECTEPESMTTGLRLEGGPPP